MLVPAMAFAGWLVSMTTPPPARRVTSHESTTSSDALAWPRHWDAEGDLSPRDPGAAGDFSDEKVEPGERVPLKVVTPAIAHLARTFLDLPMGAERTAFVDGRRYLFVLERHYHPPGFVGGPTGWHKGVTVYELR